MNRFIPLTLAAAIGITAIAGTAIGDGHADKFASQTVKARQAQMQLQAHNLGILGEMAKGELPYDMQMASAAATNLHALASFDPMLDWPAGTAQGSFEGTRAAPAIWEDSAGFADEWVKFEAATNAMKTAAGTDLEALRGAIGAVGASCGSCHKAYRGPRN